MLKMHIFTSVWSAQHPKAGRNTQQEYLSIIIFEGRIELAKKYKIDRYDRKIYHKENILQHVLADTKLVSHSKKII